MVDPVGLIATVRCRELSGRGDEPPKRKWEGLKVQNCDECLRLEALLQESGVDYLAAANRYNTWLLTGLDKVWAGEALQIARIANAERQRQFDAHAEKHARPAMVMTAGA